MIPEFIKKETAAPGQVKDKPAEEWRELLKGLITHPESLKEPLNLSNKLFDDIQLVSQDFPLRIPRQYLDRIQITDIHHPLLKQFIPSPEELIDTEGYGPDPVAEAGKNIIPGLVHKYPGRVLLVISSSCPVHCRYCFRRHFPYNHNRNSRADWQQAIDYIRNDSSIREVIYSGGDPLSATDDQLDWLTRELSAISHLTRLRVHTRFPMIIPQRVTDKLLAWLTGSRLIPSVVLHCNHPDELNPEVARALRKLRDAGVTLLNQSVLLKGVNNQPETLIALSEKLYACGVLPYYLHLLDKVAGAAHFEVPDAEALTIYQTIQAALPGYLLPRLVREEAGKSSKTVIGKSGQP